MIWRLWCNHVVWSTLYHWRSRFHWIYHRDQRLQRINNVTFLENKFGGHQSFLWSHWYRLDFGLWTGDVCPEFQNQVGFFALIFPYVHAMDSSDSPLVRYLLTSWQPAWQPSLFDPLTCKCISLLNLNDMVCPGVLVENDRLVMLSEGYNWICALVTCKVGFYCPCRWLVYRIVDHC